MDFSLITHHLVDTITVEGRSYQLSTKTMKALQAFAVLDEADIPEEIKISRILDLMLTPSSAMKLKANPEDTPEVYRGIADFLRGWPTDEKPKDDHREEVLSFSEDHALIIAAFRQAYGIDLTSLRALHWWEFRALLQGLPEDTVLSRTIGIRTMKIDPKDPPKVKAAKRRAKEAAALKRKGGREKTGEEIISEAFASL